MINENVTQVLIANAKNSRQLFEIALRFISNRANKKPLKKQNLNGRKMKFKELNRGGKLENIKIKDSKYWGLLKKKLKKYGVDFYVQKQKIDNGKINYKLYFKAIDKEALEKAYKEVDRYFESKFKKKEKKKEKKTERRDKKEKAKNFWEEFNKKEKSTNSKTENFTETKTKETEFKDFVKESLSEKINRIKDAFKKNFKSGEEIWQRKR